MSTCDARCRKWRSTAPSAPTRSRSRFRDRRGRFRSKSFAMRARAFAKINLSLRIVRVRPDGYHELRTIFQSIALFDTLTVRRVRGPFTLTSDDPACPIDETNLVARAAAAVWKAAGRRGAPRDVRVHLAKRIPTQAARPGEQTE